jgi:sec-independent protein translocase protein TatA
MLGSTEIIVLVVVIGVLIFGAKKIPELAKTFGKAKGEFEKGKIQGDKELKDFKGEIDNAAKDTVNKDNAEKDNVTKDNAEKDNVTKDNAEKDNVTKEAKSD